LTRYCSWPTHLAGHEDVVSPDYAFLDLGIDSGAHLLLILIYHGAVNVAVPCVNGVLHNLLHFAFFTSLSNKYVLVIRKAGVS
jgi:hypothetical protein